MHSGLHRGQWLKGSEGLRSAELVCHFPSNYWQGSLTTTQAATVYVSSCIKEEGEWKDHILFFSQTWGGPEGQETEPKGAGPVMTVSHGEGTYKLPLHLQDGALTS